MGDGRLGQGRPRKHASIGDIVICIDPAQRGQDRHTRRFVGLVVDKTYTIYTIRVLETGQLLDWPIVAAYLWKEIK